MKITAVKYLLMAQDMERAVKFLPGRDGIPRSL